MPDKIPLLGDPAITFTVPLYITDSIRSPRLLFTLNSSACLSVWPRNCVPGVVPEFPLRRQNVLEARVELKVDDPIFVRLDPSPLNFVAVKVPLLETVM